MHCNFQFNYLIKSDFWGSGLSARPVILWARGTWITHLHYRPTFNGGPNMYTYIYIYITWYIHTYTYIYIYICMHIYIYIYHAGTMQDPLRLPENWLKHVPDVGMRWVMLCSGRLMLRRFELRWPPIIIISNSSSSSMVYAYCDYYCCCISTIMLTTIIISIVVVVVVVVVVSLQGAFVRRPVFFIIAE